MNNLQRLAVVYPSGNTTAVVFDALPASQNRKMLNKQIIRAWEKEFPDRPAIEQCCLVATPRSADAVLRVAMFGGEFCGNATRGALWLLAKDRYSSGLVEVSGVDYPLAFEIQGREVLLEMPLPRQGQLLRPVAEGQLVQLDGITQLVVSQTGQAQNPRALLTKLLSTNTYDLARQPCVGVACYDSISGQAQFCVWVRDVGTMFDETACGSGTCAIGIARAWESGKDTALSVIQPSGEVIKTTATYAAGSVRTSFIAGTVEILYDGAFTLA
ncbi:MAG TPA: hypothetical protein VJP80_06300 [Candidatus Saccharimonadales bacterium]|nr:hypothetical protein [Candidatus Saccharimonadales bacterium]